MHSFRNKLYVWSGFGNALVVFLHHDPEVQINRKDRSRLSKYTPIFFTKPIGAAYSSKEKASSRFSIVLIMFPVRAFRNALFSSMVSTFHVSSFFTRLSVAVSV